MTTERTETETIEGKRIPCRHCGAFRWRYIDDHDNGDWVESSYECMACGRIEYVELAD
jgi:DNA-directed RNA polymerase subunit RPC12/RpoP